ncbi:MAG: GNAT family N-acetyltransferase [Bacilli bacterium]
MESLSVRRLEVSDLEKVKSIYSDSFGKKVSASVNYTNENIYVVCLDDDVVGMCMVNYMDDIFVSKRTAFINTVCVDKNMRNKGIAKFMLSEVERIVLEDGACEIMLTSSSKRKEANRLYKSLGFNIYDTNVFKKKLS